MALMDSHATVSEQLATNSYDENTRFQDLRDDKTMDDGGTSAWATITAATAYVKVLYFRLVRRIRGR